MPTFMGVQLWFIMQALRRAKLKLALVLILGELSLLIVGLGLVFLLINRR